MIFYCESCMMRLDHLRITHNLDIALKSSRGVWVLLSIIVLFYEEGQLLSISDCFP